MITGESAAGLAQRMRSGDYSAREVVEAHIEVLERANPRVNAVAVSRYEEARDDADRADALLRDGDQATLPPLLGVPMTVKESVGVAGLPNTAGVVARRAVRAAAHATVVRRLTDAGAIVLGLTNTSEACMWIESQNRIYGRTSNIHHPGRSAGGSSGGEGAAVGAGGSPFGIGTDTLGSIRIPAFCNGVFGHRPSTGLVPLTGAWPPPNGVARMCSNGLLTRRAADLMPLLRIIAGPDGIDPLIEPMSLRDPATTDLAGMQVLLIDDAFLPGVGGEVLRARDSAAAVLESAGARVRHVPMPALRTIGLLTTVVLAEETGTPFAAIMREQGASPMTVRRLFDSGGDHTLAMKLLLLGESAERLLPSSLTRRLIARARELATAVTELIGDGLLLHPTLTRVAPRHGTTVGRPWTANGVAPFSLAGLPVTQVPLGRGRIGLPVGVQVVAGHGADHRCIAAALELERHFGGWVAPEDVSGGGKRPAVDLR